MSESLELHPFKVGDLVELYRDVERYQDFLAPAGTKGTVEEAEFAYLSVRLHKPMAGLEEWDNCIIWTDSDFYFGDSPQQSLARMRAVREE